ncbi:MAG: glycosyltransferase family 9 protein, partial [Deltaproteobacteria bacterium]|nr:glycosyltransferase family 9 protein [Deltaproteobacteria bacterium]
TTWQTKYWNDGAFAELADLLLDHRFNLVFTGGPQDGSAIANIIRLMSGKSANLAGRTSLKTLAALYTLTNLVISTDTGPMHIAAAAGTPVVAIFGPTAPWRTGPCGSQHTIMRADLPCSPCFKKKCPRNDNACMRQITAGAVYAAALKIIATHR